MNISLGNHRGTAMMGTGIELQGVGDVISSGVFDRMAAGKAIGIGQMVMKQFVTLRIVLYGRDELCYLVEFLPNVITKHQY
jgi:hypothetical protein